MPTITLDNATKFYKAERRKVAAVEDIELTVKQGEFVFLIGSSGAGKSTVLQMMSGGMRPSKGKVYLDDRDLYGLLRLGRNRTALQFGRVWQEPSLIRQKTVEENLALVGRIAGRRTEDIRLRIKKVLGLVGMAGVEQKYPVEMSLGECRRVELARALINSPPILALDEITANLDDDNIWDMLQLLIEINRRGTTVIMATHASQYVNIMRKRVITLVDGRVFSDIQKGKYGEVDEKEFIYTLDLRR